ncbi:hypothetical protein GCM10023107_33230 [Actinoplanes octamycinicus]|nr:hypothetical protein Aoc01nite_47150 [Actinoplanes octamycinicus]
MCPAPGRDRTGRLPRVLLPLTSRAWWRIRPVAANPPRRPKANRIAGTRRIRPPERDPIAGTREARPAVRSAAVVKRIETQLPGIQA